uniref:Uncharacterized protein n=1 Tax=Aegilops tauschii subsp. strangulata TaxID=200361 RepID=A0A453D477_AEGTS
MIAKTMRMVMRGVQRASVAANHRAGAEAGEPRRLPQSRSHLEGAEAARRKLRARLKARDEVGREAEADPGSRRALASLFAEIRSSGYLTPDVM